METGLSLLAAAGGDSWISAFLNTPLVPGFTVAIENLKPTYSLFVQLGIFLGVLFIMDKFYFRPFMNLFEARHKKTVEDKAVAEKLSADAAQKLEAYKKQLGDARAEARKEYEAMLSEAHAKEHELLEKARSEVKGIYQDANQQATAQKEKLRQELKGEVDNFAKQVAEKLL